MTSEAPRRIFFPPSADIKATDAERATVRKFGIDVISTIAASEEWRKLKSGYRPNDLGEGRTAVLRRGGFGFTATIELVAPSDEVSLSAETGSFAVHIGRSPNPDSTLPKHDASFDVIVRDVDRKVFGRLLPARPVMNSVSADLRYSGSQPANNLEEMIRAIRTDIIDFLA